MIFDLIEVAKLAGNAIMEIYNKSDFNQSLKADNSPLTEADLAANKIICDELTRRFGHIPLLSEESSDIPIAERENWQEYFLIDPLDGTKEFIKRNGEFTVNIAYMKDNYPVLGVVYAPAKDILYYNTDKSNAYREAQGEKQRLPFTSPVNYTIVASRSHMSEETLDYVKSLEEVHGKVNVISMGSSFKLCLVAQGSANEYPRLGPTSEWDIAAAHAIIEASGAELLDYKSKKLIKYNKESVLNPYFIARRVEV